jgi:hypothetical protein
MPGIGDPQIAVCAVSANIKLDALELAGEPDRKVADVDHLLDLTVTLGQDFPGLDGDETAELGLAGAQLLAKNPDELSTPGRRKRPPRAERFFRLRDRFANAARVSVLELANGPNKTPAQSSVNSAPANKHRRQQHLPGE